MKWNLRMAAAQRDVWKASQLHAMLADAGLVISAGKMSHLWSGRPVTIRLEDLQVICSTLGCTPNDLLVLEQDSTRGRPAGTQQPELRAAAGEGPIRRRHAGRVKPPVWARIVVGGRVITVGRPAAASSVTGGVFSAADSVAAAKHSTGSIRSEPA